MEYRTQPSPIMIAPPLNGGPAFAGRSGRNTANTCEANAMKTIIVATAAHFMVGALIRIRQHDKYNFYLGDSGFVETSHRGRPANACRAVAERRRVTRNSLKRYMVQ